MHTPWSHLTIRECRRLARVELAEAQALSEAFGVPLPVSREAQWYADLIKQDVRGAYGKTDGD